MIPPLDQRREDKFGEPLLPGHDAHLIETGELLRVEGAVDGENAILAQRADGQTTAVQCADVSVYPETAVGADRTGRPLAAGTLAYLVDLEQLKRVTTVSPVWGRRAKPLEAPTELDHRDVVIEGADDHGTEAPPLVRVRVLGRDDEPDNGVRLLVPSRHLSTTPDWQGILASKLQWFRTARRAGPDDPRVHVASRFVRAWHEQLNDAQRESMLLQVQRNSKGAIVHARRTGMKEACSIGVVECPFVDLQRRDLAALDGGLALAAAWRAERAALASPLLRDPWGAIRDARERQSPGFGIADTDPDIHPTHFRPTGDIATATVSIYRMLREYVDEQEFPDAALTAELHRAKATVDALPPAAAAAATAAYDARRKTQTTWVSNSEVKRRLEANDWDALAVLEREIDPRSREFGPIDAALETGELSEVSAILRQRGLTDVHAALCGRLELAKQRTIGHLETTYERDGRPLRPEERVKMERVHCISLKEHAWRLIAERESFDDSGGQLRSAIEADVRGRGETGGRQCPHWEFYNDLVRLERRCEQQRGRRHHSDAAVSELMPAQRDDFVSHATMPRRNWLATTDSDVADPVDAERLRGSSSSSGLTGLTGLTVTGAEAVKQWAYKTLHFHCVRDRDETLPPLGAEETRNWWRRDSCWAVFKTMLLAYESVFSSTNVPADFVVRNVFKPAAASENFAVPAGANADVPDFEHLESLTEEEDRCWGWPYRG